MLLSEESLNEPLKFIDGAKESSTLTLNNTGTSKFPEERFDTTGMFHWAPDRTLEEAILDHKQKHEFTNHVIACIFADKESPLIGLRNFVLPLRASNFFYDELKPIIFIGHKEFLVKEWRSITNFPKIFIIDVNMLFENNIVGQDLISFKGLVCQQALLRLIDKRIFISIFLNLHTKKSKLLCVNIEVNFLCI